MNRSTASSQGNQSGWEDVASDRDEVGVPPTSAGRELFRNLERSRLIADHLRGSVMLYPDQLATVAILGCSTGEELYGLAIVATDELGPFSDRISLVGFDTCLSALGVARHATYPRSSVHAPLQPFVHHHFDSTPEGDNLVVAEHHRERVRIRELSLNAVGEELPESYAAVVVLDTLDATTRAHWLPHFARRLRPGGLLALPPGVSPPADESLRPANLAGDGYFEKPPNAADDAPALPSRDRPLSVPPAGTASTLPPPPRSAQIRVTLEAAERLSRAGALDEAIELVGASMRLDPNVAPAYLLRAQLHLAGGSIEVALDDLRRLLFLAPACLLARYWFAVVLRAAGESERARAQLDEIEDQLGTRGDEELVEDERTTTAQLGRRVAVLRAQLSSTEDDRED